MERLGIKHHQSWQPAELTVRRVTEKEKHLRCCY